MTDIPKPPALLAGRYEMLRHLGTGAIGAVYECRDLETKHLFACRILSPSVAATADARRRFEHEGKALCRLSDPSLVRTESVGVDDDVPYALMELCLGRSTKPFTLAGLVARTSDALLTVGDIERIFPQVIHALGHLHSRGILHRNLRPANILLLPRRDGWVAKIADGGLVALAGDTDFESRVLTGMPVRSRGSEPNDEKSRPGRFFSPEQRAGRPVDARTDVYSMGAILFTLAAGAMDSGGPKIPRQLRSQLPVWVDDVVRHTVQDTARDRMDSAEALVALLPTGSWRMSATRDRDYMDGDGASRRPASPARTERQTPTTRRERPKGSEDIWADLPEDALVHHWRLLTLSLILALVSVLVVVVHVWIDYATNRLGENSGQVIELPAAPVDTAGPRPPPSAPEPPAAD